MRTFTSIFSLAALLLLLWEWRPLFNNNQEMPISPRAEVVGWEDRRAALIEELDACRTQIDGGIGRLEKISRQVDPPTRRSLRNLKARLERRRSFVEQQLIELKNSTSHTWRSVGATAQEVATEVKIDIQMTEESLENLVE